MTKPNNPPAFPNGGFMADEMNGMKLRDYFATQAMSVILMSFGVSVSEMNKKSVAEMSYEYADAMLKARDL